MVRSATQFPWYSRGSTPWDFFFFFFFFSFFSDFCCAATELYTVAEPLVFGDIVPEILEINFYFVTAIPIHTFFFFFFFFFFCRKRCLQYPPRQHPSPPKKGVPFFVDGGLVLMFYSCNGIPLSQMLFGLSVLLLKVHNTRDLFF